MFTEAELEEMRLADAEIEASFAWTKEELAESRARDRDEILDQMQNKERELAAKQRAYREANREEIAAKKRAYYEANREELAAKRRAYYEANREELAAKRRARAKKEVTLHDGQGG